MKSNITLQQLAEHMRNLAYDDFSRKIRWSLGVIHPKTNDGDVGFSGGIWNDPQEATTYMSISFCFSETRGIYNFKSWVNKSEIRWVFGETPTFDEFKQASEKIFIEQEFCTKPMSPYDRTSSKVYATGNKWAKENFDATHN